MWRSVFVRVQPFLCNMCSGDKSVCFAPGNTVNSRSTPKMLFPPLTVPFPHIGPRFESWWTSVESFKCAQNLFQKLEKSLGHFFLIVRAPLLPKQVVSFVLVLQYAVSGHVFSSALSCHCFYALAKIWNFP